MCAPRTKRQFRGTMKENGLYKEEDTRRGRANGKCTNRRARATEEEGIGVKTEPPNTSTHAFSRVAPWKLAIYSVSRYFLHKFVSMEMYVMRKEESETEVWSGTRGLSWYICFITNDKFYFSALDFEYLYHISWS